MRDGPLHNARDRPDAGPVNEFSLRIERGSQDRPVGRMPERCPERQVKFPDDLDRFHDFRGFGDRLLEALASVGGTARERQINPCDRPRVEDGGVELSLVTDHGPGLFKAPQPVERSAVRKLDAPGNILDRGARACLQETEDLEVNPVQPGPGRRVEGRDLLDLCPVGFICCHHAPASHCLRWEQVWQADLNLT